MPYSVLHLRFQKIASEMARWEREETQSGQ